MNSMNPIGTLIRCADLDERRVAFYQEIGLDCIQIAGVYEDWLAPTEKAERASNAFFELFRKYGISVPTMFMSYPNQDWLHHETGVGLVPAHTRAERMILSCRLMNWGKRYGIRYMTCHTGVIPAEPNELYEGFISDMKQLAMFAAANGQDFLFETGTETVATLKRTLEDINMPNVGINFDPANLLIYDHDDPIVLVNELAKHVRVVHCKDANRPVGGAPEGRETVLDQGSVRFSHVLKSLLETGFCGPLIIERELLPGPEQERDIRNAVILIKNIIQQVKSC